MWGLELGGSDSNPISHLVTFEPVLTIGIDRKRRCMRQPASLWRDECDENLKLILEFDPLRRRLQEPPICYSHQLPPIYLLCYEINDGNALGGKLASYAAMILKSFPASCFPAIKQNPKGLPDFL